MAGRRRDHAGLAVVAVMAIAYFATGPSIAKQRARVLDGVGSMSVAALESDQEAEVLRYLTAHGPSLGIRNTED